MTCNTKLSGKKKGKVQNYTFGKTPCVKKDKKMHKGHKMNTSKMISKKLFTVIPSGAKVTHVSFYHVLFGFFKNIIYTYSIYIYISKIH